MPAEILCCVHSFAEWHIGGWAYDSRTELFGVLEVPIDVVNMHQHILVDFGGTRRPEVTALSA